MFALGLEFSLGYDKKRVLMVPSINGLLIVINRLVLRSCLEIYLVF
jgi:hypothetical protein